MRYMQHSKVRHCVGKQNPRPLPGLILEYLSLYAVSNPSNLDRVEWGGGWGMGNTKDARILLYLYIYIRLSILFRR